MKKLHLYDAFCGAGGAAMGYCQAAQEAGINLTITGVDNRAQPEYPFDFIQADALEFLTKNHSMFNIIHASPPCQYASRSTAMHKARGKVYPNLIPQTRELMESLQTPGIIENVSAKAVRPDVILKGYPFGLNLIRTRYFELINWWMPTPVLPRKNGSVKNGDYACIFGTAGRRKSKRDLPNKNILPGEKIATSWARTMQTPWITKDKSIAQAIPPAYTNYISAELFRQILNT